MSLPKRQAGFEFGKLTCSCVVTYRDEKVGHVIRRADGRYTVFATREGEGGDAKPVGLLADHDGAILTTRKGTSYDALVALVRAGNGFPAGEAVTDDPRPLPSRPGSVDGAVKLLRDQGYVADVGLGTALFLSLELGRPLLLEGEAGVGKTEVAKALAAGLGRPLIRLQCYEGMDLASAAYEWNYAKQMIHIRAAEGGRASEPGEGAAGGEADRISTDREKGDGAAHPGGSGPADTADLARDVFSEDFLVRRPLLSALDPEDGVAPVLLIDELDRTDEPFEAYLLEILSDFQITIPELGTVTAAEPPRVVVTSNRTREIHDALKRRCIYHWIDYPTAARELEILASRVPDAPERLSAQVVAFVQKVRELELFKRPGVAETLDWTRALMALDRHALDRETAHRTLGVLLKYQDDLERMAEGGVEEVMGAVR